MPLTNFVAKTSVITSAWLNKIDALYVNIFGEATTKAEAIAALGAVGLTGNETIAGVKTFSSDTVINGIEIGRGGGSVASNTVLGDTALDSNTTGANNTAIGINALTGNTTASDNTALGSGALASNTGASNTAVGSGALNANTTGVNNTALGYAALTTNTTASNNTAVGINALTTNTTASDNTALGSGALASNTGASNTAVGSGALNANTTGVNNTAVGTNALLYNTTGSGNTAINPLNSAGVYAPVFDPTIENNRLCAGSTGVTNAYVQVAWTVVSDARDKRDIGDVPHGLDFVSKLQPISYRFKMSREDDTPNGPLRYGFLAQDIMALEGTNGVIIDSEDTEKLRYNESAMVTVLVKAIQELRAEFYAYKLSHP